MKTLFSYFQQVSLPKVRETRLQADFVTNNQILVVKIIKIRPRFLFRPLPPPTIIRVYGFFRPSLLPAFIKTPSSIRNLRLYNDLGFESLKFRCWSRKLCTFYKIKTSGVPQYLFDLIPETNHIFTILVHQIMLQCFTAGLMYISILSFHIQY